MTWQVAALGEVKDDAEDIKQRGIAWQGVHPLLYSVPYVKCNAVKARALICAAYIRVEKNSALPVVSEN